MRFAADVVTARSHLTTVGQRTARRAESDERQEGWRVGRPLGSSETSEGGVAEPVSSPTSAATVTADRYIRARSWEAAVTRYDFRYTPSYADCIKAYTRRTDVLASLKLALAELATEPFGNPRLQTHAIKRAPDGTYTSYVGSLGHRLIWRLVGRVIVLLLFGEHDPVYRRAERLRLEIDDTQNVIRVFDEDPETEQPRPYDERREVEGTLFMAWNDREMADLGFEPHEIAVLRRLDDEDALLGIEGRMRDEAWTRAANPVMYGYPDGEAAASEQLEAAPGEDELVLVDQAEEQRLESALQEERATREFVPVAAEDLAQVLARPIEDWMVYLDPSQRSLVERTLSGPARIRGAAGTGKTVVALHRARSLALSRLSDGGRILFTTFVNNLPPVYEQLFRRLAPECGDRVEFKNVHRWATPDIAPVRAGYPALTGTRPGSPDQDHGAAMGETSRHQPVAPAGYACQATRGE
jgi:hypothetical protein